jgi:hypothetical protein
VKVVVAQTVVGECINVRRIDQRAEATNLSKPDIVQQEDDDVRRIFVRPFFFGPPFLRVIVAFGDTPPKPSTFLVLTPESETENSSVGDDSSPADSSMDPLSQAPKENASKAIATYFI